MTTPLRPRFFPAALAASSLVFGLAPACAPDSYRDDIEQPSGAEGDPPDDARSRTTSNLAFAPDGSSLYVPLPDLGAVGRVDRAGRLVAHLEVGGEVTALGVLDDGRVAASGPALGVVVLDGSLTSVAARVDVAGTPADLHPAESELVVLLREGALVVLSDDELEEKHRVELGHGAAERMVVRDHAVLTTHLRSAHLVLTDWQTGEALATIDVGAALRTRGLLNGVSQIGDPTLFFDGRFRVPVRLRTTLTLVDRDDDEEEETEASAGYGDVHTGGGTGVQIFAVDADGGAYEVGAARNLSGGGGLLVTLEATDRVFRTNGLAVTELFDDRPRSLGARTQVRRHFTGLAVWSDTDLAFYNPVLPAVSVGRPGRVVGSDFGNMDPLHSVAIPSDVYEGRLLFHDRLDPRLTTVGVSCAICHPEGGSDGNLVNDQIAGVMVNTMPLWGGVPDTAPLHWRNDVEDFAALNTHTIVDRMGGEGLEPSDMAKLQAFVDTLAPPVSPQAPDPELVTQGRAIFESSATGCTACHADERGTDGQVHQLDGRSQPFATPLLIGLPFTAPYMADGSAPSLEDVVEDWVRSDRMGTGSHLNDEEAAALVAFLATL